MKSSAHVIIPMLALLSCCRLSVAQKAGWVCKDGYWYNGSVKSDYQCSNTDKNKTGKSGEKDKKGKDNKDKKGSWVCKDGYWHNGAVKSEIMCSDGDKSKKGPACTNTDMAASGFADKYPRTCITAPAPGGTGPRCWWTHVPDAVSASDNKDLRVPLVIDMHGGGGCATHQAGSSGYKEMADMAKTAEESFVVVWPQAAGQLWASCGSDCTTDIGKAAAKGKKLATHNDMQFLEQLIANMVKASDSKIDPERVFVTGFSMGCMMAHRFAMEKGKLVAGLGCHGGELSLVSTNVAAEMTALKQRFNIQPMPVVMTIGTEDVWRSGAVQDFSTWAFWNDCTKSAVVNMTLSTQNSLKGENLPSTVKEHIRSDCHTYTPALKTVMMDLQGGHHVPDSRLSAATWQRLKSYSRAGALAGLPTAVKEISPTITTTKTLTNEADGGSKLGKSMTYLSCFIVCYFFFK